MTRFSVRNASREVISADQRRVWDAMVDPALLAELTPLVDSITADGDLWTWKLAGIEAMGVSARPTFTVQMTFDEPERMSFVPIETEGADNAGTEGVYLIEAVEGGTALDIDVTMFVDLPLPRAVRRPVERIMATSTQAAGDRFFANLLEHLDAERVTTT